ncbi:MAG TPA: TIGR00730 family Rossman fold protein [bacterium]|nr:TIGR00730 family Rossman fold protein [bacterium]HPP86285.1 TIGR00730 family Rossman fold protein [bacterium]
MKINNICVFCGSNKNINEPYKSETEKLAKLLVKNNLTLVYGGANVGLMGVLSDTMMKNNGKVIGIIPKFMMLREIADTNITSLILVNTMAERKKRMIEESDAFIALPGGIGTLDEIFEVIALTQLNKIVKPCAFLNINGYYDKLIEFLEYAVSENFISSHIIKKLIITNTADVLLKKMLDISNI